MLPHSQPVAGEGEGDHQREERKCYHDKQQVSHRGAPFALIVLGSRFAIYGGGFRLTWLALATDDALDEADQRVHREGLE
jgi:hypothetical protein